MDERGIDVENPDRDRVWPYECLIKFEQLSCEEIMCSHEACADSNCLVCQFHDALTCSQE